MLGVQSDALLVGLMVWMGILWGEISTQDESGVTPPPSLAPVMQVPAPKETPRGVASMGQDFIESVLSRKDHILAQKGVTLPSGLPPNLVPMLGKGLGAGAEALSPDQPLLRKMLPSHSASLPPAYELPTEPPEAVATPSWDTDAPTPHPKPSGSAAAPTTVSAETAPGAFTSAVTNCKVNFCDPEGYIDSSDDPPLPEGAFLQCTYTVTVYTGYGVELQVKSVNLSEGEQLSIRGVDEGGALLVLANQTLLVEGQVIRSPTNTLSVFYRSSPEGGVGMFQLHYQIFRLSCALPRRPHFGEVSVKDLHLPGPSYDHISEESGPSGVILSPNWPEWYGEGEDCSWRIHVGEDKRVLLDVQLLNLSDSDMLTILDGDEVTTRILGQFVGGTSPFKMSSSTPDLTITFHSDPAGLVFGKGEGFIINYMEVSRNDSCPDLPEIQNGWKTTSHAVLVRGARITYQCDPGYDLVGSETLTCQVDLSWNTQPPFCEKIMYCTDPGHVEHSTRMLSDPKLLVGTTIQYSCIPGYILQGGATLTCYGREPGTPVWTSRLPHCVSEESVSCENPGLPDNGYQILSKRLYLPGESLTFMCYQGYELIGEMAIKCILGNPSFWSGPLPLCRANHECSSNHALEVAEAAADSSFDGGSMALAIFILVLLVSVLLGGTYIYVTRCRYHSNLRLPLMYPHPYSQITVETEFDNPLYETGGDTREYEVSI
ncbi:seizure 6-like protein [Sinocyclocheilus anshuiensis]|uniref:seizure 6-like protein n=1 Tax=Sinocyclocheilus anshuiensis TaxID=1608454 RepID=UPI0007B92F10|nr:PREDICTED: seizure 6-like protein [Sinocyclocheilus anshuiensis]